MMYSVIGWCYEVFLEVFIYKWGFTNRGFLFGPYCPIYGFGAILFIVSLKKIKDKSSPKYFKFIKPFILFLSCMLISTTVELITSYIMEFLIGDWPWQTYSKYDINFQARIALSPSIRFGLGGLFFLYILQPLFKKIIIPLDKKLLDIVFYIVLLIFVIDIILKIL